MKILMHTKSKWPLMTTALVTGTSHLQMHLKELVRANGWRIDDPPASAEMALAYLENGTSFFFIVEDSQASSAYEAIRCIISHPAGRLTPILALLLEGSFHDATIYERILHVGVTKKPLTPSQFLPSFQKFVSHWETPVFLALRKCAYLILNGNTPAAMDSLKKLSLIPQAVALATHTLTRLYVQQGDWKNAEQTLLGAVKLHPRLPSLTLTLADFYAEAHMPAQALKFYIKLKGVCNSRPIFSFDIAQAALSLGRIDVAIEALSEWNASRPGSEVVTQYLARLFMAEGREEQLEKVLNMNKVSVKRIQDIWEKAETQAIPQTKAS
ncbi:MAG: hypothetical protein NTV34_18245 [Proteobacteria bacterium]|nr:hypothetical protein [Pseudomonadota bacterium]